MCGVAVFKFKFRVFSCFWPIKWTCILRVMNLIMLLVFSGVHVTLESLMKDEELKTTIKGLVRGSGRSYPFVGETDGQENQETAVMIPGKHQAASGQEKIPVGKQLNGVPRKETSVF